MSLPTPPRNRLPALGAGLVGALGVLLVVLAIVELSKPVAPAVVPSAAPPAPPPSPPAAAAPLPAPGTAVTARVPAPQPRRARDRARAVPDARRFARNDREHVRADWVAGFYPLYERAAAAFGVNWMLIASVHKQETGFSTHTTTYRGLNFANCCAGPMQFNVTNGPPSTWTRMKDAYRRAKRPATYNHPTAKHPSVYDDFDAIMAAAALLKDGGAGVALDGAAWSAAYAYYGYDLTGVDYASQVLARAIGWARTRFCINCAVDADLQARLDTAWGAPARAGLLAAEQAQRRRERAATRKRERPETAKMASR